MAAKLPKIEPTTESGATAISGKNRFAREYADLERWTDSVPESATVKGMFLKSFLDSLDRGGYRRPTSERFVAFKDYPLRLFMRLMLDAVSTAWPHLPPHEGLRALGQGAFPTLASSVAGKVLFSVAGRNFAAALPLTEKAYALSLSLGTAKLVQMTENSATLELRNIYNFADSYQVGVMEGAMTAFRVEGSVTAKGRGRRCDVDLLLSWT